MRTMRCVLIGLWLLSSVAMAWGQTTTRDETVIWNFVNGVKSGGVFLEPGGGPGVGGGHMIQDEGVDQPQRVKLNFVGGGVTVGDTPGSDETTVTITGVGVGLADPGSNGIVVRTGAGTTAARTITGTANQITCTNGDGVAGNPTCGIATNPILSGNVTATSFIGALTGNASTASAFASNPANCPNATDLAAGINASGVAEGCVDVATQSEFNTHTGTTSAVHGSTASNALNTIVQRDGSGNFSANIITAVTFSGNASTASALNANPANCTNATDLAAGITAAGVAEGCVDVATQVELDAHAALTSPHSATTTNTANRLVLRDASGDFSAGVITAALIGNASTATALASNPANCSAGELAAGVDAAGVAEGCTDVVTQTELTTHAALTTAHGSTSANTPSTIVQRDGSGNFTAGTITATLTGNALTATALAANGANCSAGELAAGVNALGEAEGCTDVATQTELTTHANLTTAHGSTSANTASTIVQRDGSGNFSAGTITAVLTGNASTASALAANPANCTNATDLAAGITAAGVAEGCIDVATQVELDAHAALTNPHSATSANTPSRLVLRDASGNFVAGTITATVTGNASTATALAANGANCSAGNAPIGVDTTGTVENCFDVATQTELDTHAALTTTHGAVSTNTASRIVLRDGSGNFSAGTITATLTGNASTATALAANGTNCGAGEAAAGVDASGNAEGCTTVGGGGGTPVVLDLGDNGSNESTDLAEIAVTGDTNSIFTESSDNKLLINVALDWPKADLADLATALAANGANCSAGSSPLGVDASGAVESCFDIATQTELDTHANLTTAHGSVSTNTPSTIVQRDGSGNFAAGTITATLTGNASTATALAANGGNCSAGELAAGVSAAGVAEGCIDVATQVELDAHAALTNPHSATSANTASRLVLRDASGDFSAGTIVANLQGAVTGNASTATALAANGANCSAGSAPLGVDASGAVESCFDVATQTELDTHANLTNPHSATATNTASRIVLRDASGDFAAGIITAALVGNVTGNVSGTAGALAANGANCSAGNAPLGVDTAGAVEGCFDIATQAELDTHAALTTAHGSVSTNTPSTIVQRDGSGNFSAGTITATLTGNASTATALAANGTNCGAGEAAQGVDASGNAEGCTSIAGGGGTSVALDLGDNGVNESAALAEIATVNDAPGIFTESSDNKLLINVGLAWPTATALAANGANCSAGSAPLGVDASGAVESCFDVATQGELDTHAALTTAHGSTATNTASMIVQRDGSGNFAAGTITAALSGNASTASALAANGANCSAGSSPLGVDASGAAESCFDVGTQVELDAHAALTNPHSATSTNTASRLVLRDASGNFAAGTITANVTGTASLATALAANGANCSAGNAPLGVDASGAVESCFDVGTQVEIDAHAALTNPHSATSANTASRLVLRDASGNFSANVITATTFSGNATTASAFLNNPLNCDPGNAPLGVDAAGVVESCFDVGTQAELTAGLATKATIVGTPVATRIAEWTSATSIQAVTTTGTGSVVRQDSPSLNTPNLGIPTAIDLTNATNFPLAQVPKAVRAAMVVSLARMGGF